MIFGPRGESVRIFVRPGATDMRKAVTYALGQWYKLPRYLKRAHLTPDTNQVENKIRPFVIGRKNWLFSGSPRGAAAMAGLYSLIETAKANGLDPYRYLQAMIRRLPRSPSGDDRPRFLTSRLDPNQLARGGVHRTLILQRVLDSLVYSLLTV